MMVAAGCFGFTCFSCLTNSCRSLSRPDTPHWIVTLSPISMHLDAEVGELLKPFGVRKMTRVSAQELRFSGHRALEPLMDRWRVRNTNPIQTESKP